MRRTKGTRARLWEISPVSQFDPFRPVKLNRSSRSTFTITGLRGFIAQRQWIDGLGIIFKLGRDIKRHDCK